MLNECCCCWSWSDYSPVSHVRFTCWCLQALALKVNWKYIKYLLLHVSAHCLCVCRWSFKMTRYWLLKFVGWKCLSLGKRKKRGGEIGDFLSWLAPLGDPSAGRGTGNESSRSPEVAQVFFQRKGWRSLMDKVSFLAVLCITPKSSLYIYYFTAILWHLQKKWKWNSLCKILQQILTFC